MSKKTPIATPAPKPQVAEEPIKVKIVHGLAMVDPLTQAIYTHTPSPVLHPSSWVSTHLELGNLVRV